MTKEEIYKKASNAVGLGGMTVNESLKTPSSYQNMKKRGFHMLKNKKWR